MSVNLSPTFLCELNSLQWRDVRWGVTQGFMSPQDVIAFALCRLGEHSSDAEYAIASCDPKDSWGVDKAVDRAADLEPDDGDPTERWLFSALMKTYEESQSADQFLTSVEDIYETFGYPEVLARATVSGFPGRIRPTVRDQARQRDNRVRSVFTYLLETAARIGARAPRRPISELSEG